MNVRELAEHDLTYTLENTNGSGSPLVLIAPDSTEFPVTGKTGDIGILFLPDTGEAVRSRSIVCTVRIGTLAELTELVPERGWRARVKDLRNREISLFVQGNDADRTLGVYRLRMGLDLGEGNE
jgi:hypothetical protein